MSEYITEDDRAFAQRLAERSNFETSWGSDSSGQQDQSSTDEK